MGENKTFKNKMEINFLAISENQAFARVAVAAFATQLNPTIAELTEIKTAVSEAVTNAMIHGYDDGDEQDKTISLRCVIEDREIYIEIEDDGQGIEDIEVAKEPLYTSKPDDERSGMGFTIMDEFMDALIVESQAGQGTIIKMKKTIETY
ncbi:MAG: anti-sigma F factor [Defluviitaleaceae bacterium]|nr:anti-sigma F factor [Defluviitaleaceae bacterium]